MYVCRLVFVFCFFPLPFFFFPCCVLRLKFERLDGWMDGMDGMDGWNGMDGMDYGWMKVSCMHAAPVISNSSRDLA